MVTDGAACPRGLHQCWDSTADSVRRLGPTLPDPCEVDGLRRRIAAEFDRLEEVMASATVEERRELIACYVHAIKADPNQQVVHIGLYPTLLSQKIAGAGFEPATSGL